jgi:hypothetical protein
MSFASTIVLKDAAAASENFLRLAADSQKVTYCLQTATLSEPVVLTVGHQMTSAQDGSDRHLVKITRTVLDSDSRPRTLVLNCTISVPRLGISRTDIDDSVAELKEFFSTANVDALLRGEL